ncbi:hypothetical protein GGR56DRAFT_507256 [Xylariaceae sp. FL0804]|nr:hypothetical protein GGR56DRAFT_507256 [Xylariaceae sp. FL0804]
MDGRVGTAATGATRAATVGRPAFVHKSGRPLAPIDPVHSPTYHQTVSWANKTSSSTRYIACLHRHTRPSTDIYPQSTDNRNNNNITMQFLATLLGAAALLTSSVSAQLAVVTSNCNETIYVQSVPYDGSASGPLTALTQGQSYSEAFHASGSIGIAKTLNAPLFFGYSLTSSPDYAYYELSTEYGNPFADQHNILTPGSGCQQFDCAAGQTARPRGCIDGEYMPGSLGRWGHRKKKATESPAKCSARYPVGGR